MLFSTLNVHDDNMRTMAFKEIKEADCWHLYDFVCRAISLCYGGPPKHIADAKGHCLKVLRIADNRCVDQLCCGGPIKVQIVTNNV